MKYFSLLLVAGFSLTLAACNPSASNETATDNSNPATETSQPAEGVTPPADLNEPDLSGKYQEYSAEKVAMLKGEQKFGVFFHADWCPTCVKWEARTTAALDQLPDSTLILKANYDDLGDVAKSMGVKKQSSMAMFDSNGEIVDVVSDPSIEQITQFFTTPDFDVVGQAGERYVEFDQAAFDAAKGNDKMVAFFHADWCGTCRKWEKNLQANLDQLAPNAKIMKVDFDTQTTLAQELEVTKQSTAVFFNTDGTVAKTEGDPSLDSINEFFNA